MARKRVAKKQAKKSNSNGANLGFEQTLWLAADTNRRGKAPGRGPKLLCDTVS